MSYHYIVNNLLLCSLHRQQDIFLSLSWNGLFYNTFLFFGGVSTGVIERWEIIQAQSLSNELSAKQNLQQWQQFNSDLDNISLWLEKTEAELDSAEKLKPSTSIQELEQKVKQFKVRKQSSKLELIQ